MKFGEICIADSFHGRDKKMKESSSGDKEGLAVYDIGTDFGYCL